MKLLPTTYYLLPTARSWRAGQSLIELLVALGVGTVLVVGAISIISPTVKTQGDVTHSQVAAGLGKELLDNTRVFTEGNWHGIDYLSTSSAFKYYLTASTSPFTVATGTESVLVATTTYTRYFYLDDVKRNASAKIDADGTSYDPSTKKITVVYNYGSTTNSLVSYLARTGDNVFVQTDWSGGGNQSGPITVTSTNTLFATSSGVDYSTTTGSIVISGF